MDYTLLRVDAGRETSLFALKENLITKGFVLKYLWWSFLFKINILDFPEIFRRGTGRIATDKPVVMAMDLGQRAFERSVRSLIFSTARTVVRQHMDKGHLVVLVTSSPAFVVEPVRKELGIPYALTTRLESRDGIYTGVVEFVCYAEQKPVAMREFAENNNIDLAQSYAYSDHHSDIPMLSLVGNPVCVNPTRRLARYAKSKNWQTVTFE